MPLTWKTIPILPTSTFYSQSMADKTIQSRRRRPGTEENDDLENVSEDDDKKVKKSKPLRYIIKELFAYGTLFRV